MIRKVGANQEEAKRAQSSTARVHSIKKKDRAMRIAAVTNFEARCKQREHFISESEKDLDQKRLENLQNQINPDEVEEELQEGEKALQKERSSLQADIADLQDCLASHEKEGEEEGELLQVMQDKLTAQDQELLNTVEEEDEDKNEKMRRLSALLERNTPRREHVLPSEEIAPPDQTNEQ